MSIIRAWLICVLTLTSVMTLSSESIPQQVNTIIAESHQATDSFESSVNKFPSASYKEKEQLIDNILVSKNERALELFKGILSGDIFYVKKNQNLGYILEKVGIQTPNRILEKKKNNCLYNIYVNDKITIKTKGKKLYSIERKNNSINCIYKTEDNSIKKVNKNLETDRDLEQYIFFNNIDNSFYKSALKSGLSPNEIMSLADIFGWDIDFSLEIRKGDSFGVVIDRRFLGKKYIGSDIKYAVFKNKKRVIEAYRYKKKYYNSKGVSLQKQFLKAPVDFYRISSHFNKKRLHPIFKTVRPHLGTDYAAPKGTPVYSTGDGTIIYKGRKGGYGNTIIVKHGNIYSTLYAHFSKYKKGTFVGKKVKQKEIIGYVGSTGYATGPHVHYEFRVRGIHKNVLKIKFKKGKRLNKKTINKMKSIHQKNIPIYLWLNKTM